MSVQSGGVQSIFSTEICWYSSLSLVPISLPLPFPCWNLPLAIVQAPGHYVLPRAYGILGQIPCLQWAISLANMAPTLVGYFSRQCRWMLIALLRRMYGSEAFEISQWAPERIHGGLSVAVGCQSVVAAFNVHTTLVGIWQKLFVEKVFGKLFVATQQAWCPGSHNPTNGSNFESHSTHSISFWTGLAENPNATANIVIASQVVVRSWANTLWWYTPWKGLCMAHLPEMSALVRWISVSCRFDGAS